MIDTHCHLFEENFTNDLQDCLSRCKENNVNKLIVVGFSKETNQKAYELAKLDANYYPTAGMHPDEADNNYLEKIESLKQFVKTHKVYAIGECGLDYHYTMENKEIQKEMFKMQCDLAVDLSLPIIVHMRDATEDTYNILKEYKGKLKGVMHCYTGSLEMAYRFIELGFYISLGGPVTFKNANHALEVAKNVPIDKLLLETDCPFMAPVPKRGTRNESSYVVFVYKKVAELRDISLEELDNQVESNVKKLFNI